MSHYLPSFLDPTDPDRSPVLVRTPTGAVYNVLDAALAKELHSPGAQVIKQNRGIFDSLPLSLITTQSIAVLSDRVGAPLEVERFRPNILVEAADPAPFVEDDWVGCVLRVGGVKMRIDRRDTRCAVITINPVTSRRDPSILRTVVRDRAGNLGVYGSTVCPGRISIGDAVVIQPTA